MNRSLDRDFECVAPGGPAAAPWRQVDRVLRRVRFDTAPAHRQPAAVAVIGATIVAVAGSLLADWLLARLGVTIFASDKGYAHFQFGDYATLTVIGVVVAGVGWPVVTRLCAAPRWLFARLAAAVTAVLLLPDLWIFLQGQPGRAVVVLVAMHLAIGVITYHALVRLAPTRARFAEGARAAHASQAAPAG